MKLTMDGSVDTVALNSKKNETTSSSDEETVNSNTASKNNRKSKTRMLNFATTDEEGTQKRRQIRDPQSHRIIEKRRRDRMNNCLVNLLKLIPQGKPESQRRIEKAEIIEMATKYIQSLNEEKKRCLSTWLSRFNE